MDTAREDETLTAELTRRMDAWWEALRERDWGAARTFMRNDFSITTAGWIDAPLGADAWLESLAGRYELDSFDYDEVRVRRYGDVAVMQSRSRQAGTIRDTGEPWAATFRYTDVWVRHPKLGWQVAVRHAGTRPVAPARLADAE